MAAHGSGGLASHSGIVAITPRIIATRFVRTLAIATCFTTWVLPQPDPDDARNTAVPVRLRRAVAEGYRLRYIKPMPAPSRLAAIPFAVLLLVSGQVAAQLPPGGNGRDVEHAVEEVGSWLLTCTADPMTDRSTCRLLLRQPAVAATLGQSALTLEVVRRGDRAVPAITARDLTIEGVGRGLLAFTGTAQLRFPPNKLFELPCGLEGRSVVCAPRDEDAARAATELAAADRALVRIVGLVPSESEAVNPTELRLRDTASAISRWRARAPADEAPASGLDFRGMLWRLLRFLNT